MRGLGIGNSGGEILDWRLQIRDLLKDCYSNAFELLSRRRRDLWE